jgi:hypothetical protein
MSDRQHVLLDAIDTHRRLLQHGAIFAGIGLLAVASLLVDREGPMTAGLAAIAAGLLLLVAAAGVRQQWDVTYKGHQIRFENNPFRGEKLFIDGRRAAVGKLGFRSELRASIDAGAGRGDRIVASTVAGFLRFRCRIVAEPGADAVAAGISDGDLLAEVRRRGLGADRS